MQTSGDLAVDISWDYIPVGRPKKNKYGVYIPMGGSPTTNFVVYTHFGVSPKLKVKPLTLIIYYIVRSITWEVKNKLDNMLI